VRESAVIAAKNASREQVHAVLVLNQGASAEATINEANKQLEPHQRIRGFSIWPRPTLPRTSGTNKLKRLEIAGGLGGPAGSGAEATRSGDSSIADVVQKFSGGRAIDEDTSLNDLALSSLDRIQLMMELEQRTGASMDESQFAGARTVGDLSRVKPAVDQAFEFPEWNRARPARWLRRIALPGAILPLARLFAWIGVEGLENLSGLEPPVIFASNHQSHFDVPAILCALPAKWRYRIAPAMAKEFFDAHFYPEAHPLRERFTNGLNYFLASLVFNAFPLPQREAGARGALRYAGDLAADGYCILIFPEGVRTNAGEVNVFQPGVGMLASRLRLPVVPVRLEGLERVLHKSAKFATPGRAIVKFGPALRLEGDDYAALAKRVEAAVRGLS
jgi:long-chain acyl-CoA synthetase